VAAAIARRLLRLYAILLATVIDFYEILTSLLSVPRPGKQPAIPLQPARSWQSMAKRELT
jgi:hypothetical protein